MTSSSASDLDEVPSTMEVPSTSWSGTSVQETLQNTLQPEHYKWKTFVDCYEKTGKSDKRKCRLCFSKINKKPFNLRRHLRRNHIPLYNELEKKIKKENERSSVGSYF